MYRAAPLPAELRRARPGGRRQGLRKARSDRGRTRRPPHDSAAAGYPPHQVDGFSSAPPQRASRPGAEAGTLDFDQAFGKEDQFTQAVTLFALLELYRRGRRPERRRRRSGGSRSRRYERRSPPGRSSRPSCSSRPSPSRRRSWPRRSRWMRTRSPRRSTRSSAGWGTMSEASSCARSPAAMRLPLHPRRRTPLAAYSRSPGPRRSPRRKAEVLAIVAYLQPVSRPEVARIRGVSSDSAA